MPNRDLYHPCVKHALVRDGWHITHDPFSLKLGKKDMFVDLGAERFLAAEKQNIKIAVEIKSFIGASEVEDLRNAIGQYILHRAALKRFELSRLLYLAIREITFIKIFEEEIGQALLEDENVKLLIFSPEKEVVVRWID